MRKNETESSSSVGSNSSFPSLSSSSSSLAFIDVCARLRTQQQQQQQVHEKNNKDQDECFRCKQKGHWANQCPQNTNTSSNISNNNGEDQEDGECVDLMCPCGAGCCNIVTSKTPRNPNRKYYRCPLSGAKGCNTFLEWCDDVFLITGSPPPCPCRAGPCSVTIQYQHHLRRRPHPSYSFVCPIKKGHGACNFMEPVDEITGNVSTPPFSPKSTLTGCCFSVEETSTSTTTTTTTTSRPSISFISTDKISAEEDESNSSVVVSSQPQETATAPPPDDEMWKKQVEVSPEDEESSIHPRLKRLRDWFPKKDDDDSGVDFNCNTLDVIDLQEEEEPCKDILAIQTSSSSLLVLVHPQQQRQPRFSCEISSASGHTNLIQQASPTTCVYASSTPVQNCLQPTVIDNQMLGFQLEGWCGRLLFPPSRSLTFPAPRPFFCCVFPCFDPIFVPGDVQSPPPCNNNNNRTRVSIVDVFKEAATRLEEGLVSVLESMGPREHKSMLSEANLVFDALDKLSVVVADYNNSSFKERVMGFIDCALSLSELQQSTSSAIITISQGRGGDCLQEEYRRLQMELEQHVSIKCSEAYVALTACQNRLNVLTQEEARIEEMLSSIKADILCCRVENEVINSWLYKLTQDKLKLESSVEIAKEQVEQQVDVAIASFEKARSKLRDGSIDDRELL